MKIKKKIITTIMVTACLYLSGCFYVGWNEIKTALHEFQWWIVFPCLGLAFSNYFFRFLKWHYYLKLLDIPLRAVLSFKVFLAGMVMSATPGKFGEVLKSFLIKEINGTPMARSAPIILAERFTDFIALLILSLYGITMLPEGELIDAVSVTIVVLILFLVSHRKTSESIIEWSSCIPVMGKYSQLLYDAYESIYTLISPKPLFFAVGISVISWFFECLAFDLVLMGFNAHLPLMHTVFMYSFATIMGALLMTPGGIGPTEGTLGGLLIFLHHVPKGIAASATMLIRACTLWFAVLIGLLVLILYGKAFNPAQNHDVFEDFDKEADSGQ